MPLWAFAACTRSREQLKARLPEWRIAMDRWRLVYYCSRDDLVFLPSQGTAVSPDAMAELLMPAGR
jgi:hypothetical protein